MNRTPVTTSHLALPRSQPPQRPLLVAHSRASLALLAMLAVATAGGCGSESGPASFSVVNADTAGTLSVPAHRRSGWLFSEHTSSGWRVELVNADCQPLVTLTVSDHDHWLYVAPDGQATLSDLSPAGGLTEVSAEKVSHQCPLPRER